MSTVRSLRMTASVFITTKSGVAKTMSLVRTTTKRKTTTADKTA